MLTQTQIVVVALGVAVLISLRRNRELGFLTVTQSLELKGLAILAVVFSHIGFFLVPDHTFLFPLSAFAGVGVNIFLVLSGFGLTVSAQTKPLGLVEFYQKRLQKVYRPMWLTIIVFLVLDFLLLNRTYHNLSLLQSFLGFFPRADLFLDLNSPLWYFTFIIAYYLAFPLLFIKRYPLISPFLFLLTGHLLLNLKLPVDSGVLNLYQLHYWAFPVGVLLGTLSENLNQAVKTRLNPLRSAALLFLFLGSACYFGLINANIGNPDRNLEQLASLLTTLTIIGVFVIKPVRCKILEILGQYSYEIYLLHWPLMARYDLLFKYLPPAVATLGYLLIFWPLSVALAAVSSLHLPGRKV